MASDRRLRISMLVATLIVAGLLSTMRLPENRIMDPLLELIVDITRIDESPIEVVPAPEAVPIPEVVRLPEDETLPAEPNERVGAESHPTDDPVSGIGERATESVMESATQVVVAEKPVDWEAEKAEAVQNAIDEMEKTYSVNPGIDALRAAAAIKFRASEAPIRKEIWEYVEKDQLGRTVLRKGDCFRVLDDPSAVNQWVFDNFDQYITYCTYRKYIGKDLAWVEEIHERFAYLRNRKDPRHAIFETD